MSLEKNVTEQKEQIVGQALSAIRQQIEALELIGFRTMDHPISGAADVFTRFHETIENAIEKHTKHMNAKYTPVAPESVPPAATAIPAETPAAENAVIDAADKFVDPETEK